VAILAAARTVHSALTGLSATSTPMPTGTPAPGQAGQENGFTKAVGAVVEWLKTNVPATWWPWIVGVVAIVVWVAHSASQPGQKGEWARELSKNTGELLRTLAGFVWRLCTGRELVKPKAEGEEGAKPGTGATFLKRGRRPVTAEELAAPAAAHGSVAAPMAVPMRPLREVLAEWEGWLAGKAGAAPGWQLRAGLWAVRIGATVRHGAVAVGRFLRGVAGVLRACGRLLGDWALWPYSARLAARLALFGAVALWWFSPGWAYVLGGALALTVLGIAGTGPAGLGKWHYRVPGHDEVYGPALWLVLRPALRLPDEAYWETYLTLSTDLQDQDACITLTIPRTWSGGAQHQTAIQDAVISRMPPQFGEWVVNWLLYDIEKPRVEFTKKPKPKPKPKLPEMVEWVPSDNVREVMVGQVHAGMKLIQTQTATPHWGVAGGTGAGKSTTLYMAVVHHRLHGELVDIIDTKKNSLALAEGHTGVRVHKTARSGVAALGEFLVSMQAAEEWNGRAFRDYTGDMPRPVPRVLICDEWPTFYLAALSWWQHGIKGKGKPPFLAWFATILLQGRSSDHRVIIGTQQFSLEMFGGQTMVRDQVGTKMIVGPTTDPSWVVAFGQKAERIDYDTSVVGRGVIQSAANGPVEEIQFPFITPHVEEFLKDCPKAPEWFDRGEMAPWITEEDLIEAAALAVPGFLPGGQYNKVSHGGTLPKNGARGLPGPRSEAVTTGPVTPDGTAPVTLTKGEAGTPTPEDGPAMFTMREACEKAVIPASYETARKRKSRAAKRGVELPEGITVEGVTKWTAEEITTWWAATEGQG
ncbi:type IV secretory system conjugative DNA transfer family protein, partial [Kitasatospora sp. NPDC048194]|uniref:type IV secretory system conjugative DNA transfer family protein n=1 Tax=Kitasatospora sp. NPDC048194 TaxID=3364045 RepID=UPI0037172F7D